MKKNNLVFRTLNVALVLTTFVSCVLNSSVKGQDKWMPQLSTNAPPSGFATRLDYLKSFTSEKEILDARNKGLINEEEAMLAMEAFSSKMESRPMDTYGKVVDQHGQPIADVKVKGLLKVGIGVSDEHDTKTDAQGQFHFLRLSGLGLGIRLEKIGYEDGNIIPYQRPNNYLPDAGKPLIITMWKKQGAEPMAHYDVEFTVPRNGATNCFNLMTGKNDNAGGLAVQLRREPLEIPPQSLRKPFNWSLTLAITNGGLIEFTNQPYPYEAPAEGYQKAITLNFQADMDGWQSWAKRNYYFHDGMLYGRMSIEVHAGAPTPESFFEIQAYVNPSSSRNLEFDSSKQIQK